MVRQYCPNDASPIPQVAEVHEGAEVVRFFLCRPCDELFAFVGDPGRLAAGFAWDSASGGWRVFRACGAERDVGLAVAVVQRVGPRG